MNYIIISFVFFLLHLSSILKSENIQFNYTTLAENKFPESRLLIDKQKGKIKIDSQKEKIKNKIKKEKININKNKLFLEKKT